MTVLTRARSKIRSFFNRSDLDVVIPPEIVGDPFAEIICKIARRPEVQTVVEIGSSNGAGSTAALFEGLRLKPHARLYCLELSKRRFVDLESRYRDYSWIYCINTSSVYPDQFPTEEEVSDFVEAHGGTELYRNPVREVLRWLRQDREYVERFAFGKSGIDIVKEHADIEVFDLVLIDGSEFTGQAELNELYGARFVLLDDTQTFKNYLNMQRLMDDPAYELLAHDPDCRNGFAVFGQLVGT